MDYVIAFIKSPHTDRLAAINASGNRYYLSFTDKSERNDDGELVGGCSRHFRSFDDAIARFNVYADHIIRGNYSSTQIADWIRAEGDE